MNTQFKKFAHVMMIVGIVPLAVSTGPGHGHEGGSHEEPSVVASASAGAGEEDGEGHAGKGHADEVKLTADAVRRYGVKVAVAGRRALVPTFVAPARVAFDAEAVAYVGSVVKGRAVELRARVGDAVKRGGDLLVVESPELGEAQGEFVQKRTAVEVARAAVDPATSAYQRAKALYEQSQGIAFAEVQRRAAEAKAAEGAVRTAEAAVTAAANRLHLLGMDRQAVEVLAKSGEIAPRFTIRAPIGGQVVERAVTLGEHVSPEKEALMVIADTSSVWVWADVPEARLGQVGVGTEARVDVAAVGTGRFAGKVSQVAPQVDPNTRTARVRVVVANPDGALRPGMFARAELVATAAGAGEATLAVPEEAVQMVEGGPAVFVPVEGEPNTFAKRSITVGPVVGGFAPVLSGLREGEQYVAAGTFILKAELGKGAAEHEH